MIRQCLVCGNSFEHERVARAGPNLTCSPECRKERKDQQTKESHDRKAAAGCPTDKHGTATGYNVYRCRCVQCSIWSRGYQRERRRKAQHMGDVVSIDKFRKPEAETDPSDLTLEDILSMEIVTDE